LVYVIRFRLHCHYVRNKQEGFLAVVLISVKRHGTTGPDQPDITDEKVKSGALDTSLSHTGPSATAARARSREHTHH
jgi:hypothetical protein